MKFVKSAIALGAGAFCVAASGAAAAEPAAHTLDKVTITGSKTVPTADLQAVVQEQPGTKVTNDEIAADQKRIEEVLAKANVVGGIKTLVASYPKTHHITVQFVIDDHGAQAPTVTKVNARLDAQTFSGNASMTPDKLVAATGLRPGDEVTQAKLAAAQKAIGDAYKAAKLPVDVSVEADPKMLGNGKVAVAWVIKETKTKRTKPLTKEEREQQDQLP